MTMSNDIEWVDVTPIGSQFEEQMSSDGRHWRHRPWRDKRVGEIAGDLTVYPAEPAGRRPRLNPRQVEPSKTAPPPRSPTTPIQS